jgi:hypothetical protein
MKVTLTVNRCGIITNDLLFDRVYALVLMLIVLYQATHRD